MSFDPGDYSVKNASKELDGMSVEELEGVLKLELDGKHRSSLVAEIGRHIDAIKTVAEEYEEAAPAEEAPKKVVIDRVTYYRLGRQNRKSWTQRPDGCFEK